MFYTDLQDCPHLAEVYHLASYGIPVSGWQPGPPACSLRNVVVSATKAFSGTSLFSSSLCPPTGPSVVGNVESTGYSSISLLLCMERRWIFCAYLYSYFLGSVNSLTLLSCPVLHRSCCPKGATTFAKSGSVIGLLSGFPIFRWHPSNTLPFVSVLEPEASLSSPLMLHSVPSWFYREAWILISPVGCLLRSAHYVSHLDQSSLIARAHVKGKILELFLIVHLHSISSQESVSSAFATCPFCLFSIHSNNIYVCCVEAWA